VFRQSRERSRGNELVALLPNRVMGWSQLIDLQETLDPPRGSRVVALVQLQRRSDFHSSLHDLLA
jgi:hypothetical protein